MKITLPVLKTISFSSQLVRSISLRNDDIDHALSPNDDLP